MAEHVKHGVVRLDNVSATGNGALLRSVRYMGTGAVETAIDNGSVMVLDGLMPGERELFKGVTPVADDDGTIVVACTPELIYDESTKKNLWDFENEAGRVVRGFIPSKGDIFSVTEIDGTKTVGDVVCLQAGVKLNTKASATTERVIGVLQAIEPVGQITYYVIGV